MRVDSFTALEDSYRALASGTSAALGKFEHVI